MGNKVIKGTATGAIALAAFGVASGATVQAEELTKPSTSLSSDVTAPKAHNIKVLDGVLLTKDGAAVTTTPTERTVEDARGIKEQADQAVTDQAGKVADASAKEAYSQKAVEDAIAQVMTRWGRIDALVNTAGWGGPQKRAEDYTFATFRRVYEINTFGTYLMMAKTLPIMQKQKKGSIVNFGSVSGMFGYSLEIGYGSSKWSIIGMSKNAAVENGKNGVRVNSVSPGWVDTPMFASVLAGYKEDGIGNDGWDNVTVGPMGRIASPEEIANVVLFLCSEKASYINGANLLVDGGMTAGN